MRLIFSTGIDPAFQSIDFFVGEWIQLGTRRWHLQFGIAAEHATNNLGIVRFAWLKGTC